MAASKKTPWWSWNITPEDLHEQVSQYNELKLSKSYRGAVVIFFLVVFIISLAISVFFPNIINIWSVLTGFVIYAILVYFSYKGHQWALIALLVYWIFDKIATMYVTLSVGNSLVSQGIFLILGIVLIVRALKVEKARKQVVLTSESAA